MSCYSKHPDKPKIECWHGPGHAGNHGKESYSWPNLDDPIQRELAELDERECTNENAISRLSRELAELRERVKRLDRLPIRLHRDRCAYDTDHDGTCVERKDDGTRPEKPSEEHWLSDDGESAAGVARTMREWANAKRSPTSTQIILWAEVVDELRDKLAAAERELGLAQLARVKAETETDRADYCTAKQQPCEHRCDSITGCVRLLRDKLAAAESYLVQAHRDKLRAENLETQLAAAEKDRDHWREQFGTEKSMRKDEREWRQMAEIERDEAKRERDEYNVQASLLANQRAALLNRLDAADMVRENAVQAERERCAAWLERFYSQPRECSWDDFKQSIRSGKPAPTTNETKEG